MIINENQDKLYIFVDESSTLGINKEPNFVIASIIVDHKNKRALSNKIKKLKRNLDSSQKIELKASLMSFEDKQYVIDNINKFDFKINYLVANKGGIAENLFKKKSVCFNYFVYLMLKDTLENSQNKIIDIYIDNRNVKVTSEKSLQDYLNIKLAESAIHDKDIYVTYCDSKQNTNIQVADLVSNTVHAMYNLKKYHLISKLGSHINKVVLFPEKSFTN